jgi:hypothetical protein
MSVEASNSFPKKPALNNVVALTLNSTSFVAVPGELPLAEMSVKAVVEVQIMICASAPLDKPTAAEIAVKTHREVVTVLCMVQTPRGSLSLSKRLCS